MEILYEGPHFIAADKPAGWLTVPSRLGRADPRSVLGLQLQERLGTRLWPVHRLDAEVSGLVLFAKSAEAHRSASVWFESRYVKKYYEALTLGRPPGDVGWQTTWRSRLLRGKKRAYLSPRGKEAITVATYRGEHDGARLWQLEPLTGRPHQLRVHLASAGYPILGDVLYGAAPRAAVGIALWAVALDFSACADAVALGLPARIEVAGRARR